MPGHERVDLIRAADGAVRARRHRCPDRVRDLPGADLVPEGFDRRRRRPDPGQPGVDDGAGEGGVLGQESVPRVHGIRARAGCRLEDLVHAEIAFRGGLPAERVRLVRHRDVQGVEIRFAVHGHADQAGVPAGPDNADSDLATVRDEHLAH
jgi:hypothetical protein